MEPLPRRHLRDKHIRIDHSPTGPQVYLGVAKLAVAAAAQGRLLQADRHQGWLRKAQGRGGAANGDVVVVMIA